MRETIDFDIEQQASIAVAELLQRKFARNLTSRTRFTKKIKR